jgi:hypothetical protein
LPSLTVAPHRCSRTEPMLTSLPVLNMFFRLHISCIARKSACEAGGVRGTSHKLGARGNGVNEQVMDPHLRRGYWCSRDARPLRLRSKRAMTDEPPLRNPAACALAPVRLCPRTPAHCCCGGKVVQTWRTFPPPKVMQTHRQIAQPDCCTATVPHTSSLALFLSSRFSRVEHGIGEG